MRNPGFRSMSNGSWEHHSDNLLGLLELAAQGSRDGAVSVSSPGEQERQARAVPSARPDPPTQGVGPHGPITITVTTAIARTTPTANIPACGCP